LPDSLALLERDVSRAEAMLNEASVCAAKARIELTDIPWGLGLIRAFAGDYDRAVPLLEAAVSLARRERDHWAECEGLQRLALIEWERGNAAGARVHARGIARVAAKMGEGSEAPFADVLDGLASTLFGEADADGRVAQAIDELRVLDAKAQLARALLLAAVTDLERGELRRATLRAEDALSVATVVGRRSEIVVALAILARLARQRGDVAATERYIQSTVNELRDPAAVSAYARQIASAMTGPVTP